MNGSRKNGFVLCVILCGCSYLSREPTPLTIETTLVQATSTPYSTSRPMPTPTSTAIPVVNVGSLSPGEYLAYDISLSLEDTYLAVMTPEGRFIGYLLKIDDVGGRLSPDGKYLASVPYIYSLETGEKTYFEQLQESGGGSWAPDGKRLVVQCPLFDPSGEHVAGLCIFSLDDGSLTPVSTNPYPKHCSWPSWSPDGRWIAYLGYEAVSGISSYAGLHLMDTGCFSSPEDCWQDEAGIRLKPPLIWSPDGQFVAGIYYGDHSNTTAVRVYKVEDGDAILDRESPFGDDIIEWISWSPQGDQIAVWTRGGDYLLSTITGDLTRVQYPLIGNWFLVP